MAKRRAGSQTTNLTPNQKKSEIDPIYLFVDGVRHTIGKLSTTTTTLLQIASQSEACKVMGLQSCGSPNLGDFVGVPGQKAIWMWASWKGAEYTIGGKVVASPKSRPW